MTNPTTLHPDELALITRARELDLNTADLRRSPDGDLWLGGDLPLADAVADAEYDHLSADDDGTPDSVPGLPVGDLNEYEQSVLLRAAKVDMDVDALTRNPHDGELFIDGVPLVVAVEDAEVAW